MRVALCLASALCALTCDESEAPSPGASSSPSALPAPAPLVRERCVRDCNPEIVLRGQDGIRVLAIAGRRLLWGTSRVELEPIDSVQMLATRGAQPQQLASGLYGVCALATDEKYVYLTEPGRFADDHLRRVPLSGGKLELLATHRGGCGIAVTQRELVYASGGQLRAIPKGGGTARVIAKAGPSQVVRAFDETLYWSADDGVYRSSGGPATRVLATTDVYGIAITPDYLVIERGGGEPGIVCTRHDGSEARVLYGSDVDALAADESHAFVATSEGGAGAIRRIALSDGEMALLARRPYRSTTAIALHDTHVYFTDPVEGQILRVAK
jgi:hypothetical protein